MIQLTLDLPCRAALGRSDFLVSDSNAAAVSWIDRWPDWPSGVLVVYGPSGCGKSHLVHIWRERASAVIVSGEMLDEEWIGDFIADGRHRVAVENADRAPERALLHLYNFCLEARGHILLTARRPPRSWEIGLEDLGSRTRACFATGIGLPDDALLGAVLVKHFADRQVQVAPDVIAYLLRQVERSFAATAYIAARLDAVSLRDARAITIPLARALLGSDGDHAPPASDAGVK